MKWIKGFRIFSRIQELENLVSMLRQSNPWRAEEHNTYAETLRLVRDATSGRADYQDERLDAIFRHFFARHIAPGCGLLLDRQTPKAMQWSGKVGADDVKVWCCAACRPFIKDRLARLVKTPDSHLQSP